LQEGYLQAGSRQSTVETVYKLFANCLSPLANKMETEMVITIYKRFQTETVGVLCRSRLVCDIRDYFQMVRIKYSNQFNVFPMSGLRRSKFESACRLVVIKSGEGSCTHTLAKHREAPAKHAFDHPSFFISFFILSTRSHNAACPAFALPLG
jgi:hypothetical protein